MSYDDMPETIRKRPWLHRMWQAAQLGPLGIRRLRADVLLETVMDRPLTDSEREELERIAVNPRMDDEQWLQQFDDRFIAAGKK